MLFLALIPSLVASGALVSGGRQVCEPSCKLTLLVAGRRLRCANELAVRVTVVTASQVGLAVVERTLEDRPGGRPILCYPRSHEKPVRSAGSSSGLWGRPGLGSGAL